MSHPVATFDPDDFCHEDDAAASPVVDPYPSEQEMIDEELRGKVERRRKLHGRRVISPRLPQGRHSLNYDGLLPAPGRRNREIDDGGLD